MSKGPNRVPRSGKDPDYVHTSRSGRKYLKPNEVVRLDEFRESVKRLRKVVNNSQLIRDK